jgi:Metallo-beta-lactamase superfamily
VRDSAFVNAYLVETAAGVVAVDSLLTVSDSRAMRQALERLGKPLQAVLLTHSHPDHYAGLAQLVAENDVPIIAPQGVIDTIVRDDAAKAAIVGPMFGDDWPSTRIFPNMSEPVAARPRHHPDGGQPLSRKRQPHTGGTRSQRARPSQQRGDERPELDACGRRPTGHVRHRRAAEVAGLVHQRGAADPRSYWEAADPRLWVPGASAASAASRTLPNV